MENTMRNAMSAVLGLLLAAAAYGCGDDDDGIAADRLGVGAQCTQSEQCTEGQTCLPFKGGYCGLADCTANAGCPSGSLCVTHDDGKNYCFRSCVEKSECNRNRSAEVEANCVSSVDFAEAATQAKACVPPSSDTTTTTTTNGGTGSTGGTGGKK
jgi:hypothetical protein